VYLIKSSFYNNAKQVIFVINFCSAYNFNVKESFDCTGELVQSMQFSPTKSSTTCKVLTLPYLFLLGIKIVC